MSLNGVQGNYRYSLSESYPCGENAEFVNVKAGSTYAHHSALKSYNKLYAPLICLLPNSASEMKLFPTLFI